MKTTKSSSKKTLWTGRIISGICTAFLLMDSIMKVANARAAVEGSGQLGWPVNYIQTLGMVLFACTVLYVIPRTAFLGALLLTGYLGGAVAIMARAEAPGHPYFFPVVFGILVWTGLFLRDGKLMSLISFRRQKAEIDVADINLAHH